MLQETTNNHKQAFYTFNQIKTEFTEATAVNHGINEWHGDGRHFTEMWESG